MLPYQQRVVEEKQQLDERHEKLCLFIQSKPFYQLPLAEQKRLETQWHLMSALSAVLGDRIDAFAK